MLRVATILICVLLLKTANAQEITSNAFTVGPPPGWVTNIEAPVESVGESNPATEGEAYLLFDEQENAATSQSFWHVVKKITSQSGVQNGSKIQFGFDPIFEKLAVHSVRIIRDGKSVDRLDAEKFKIIQQETGLERQLYDGELSAVLFLEDVRMGDIIEYSWTKTGYNPILKGHFVSSFLVDWALPMLKQYHRTLWPSGRELTIKNHKTQLQPVVRQMGDLTEYTWELSNSPAVSFEDSTPFSVSTLGWVQMTDFPSWHDVAEWALPLYQHNPADISTDLRQKIALWQVLGTPEERVGHALRFVQDEVRYLGIEMGPHSQQPNNPETVFARRFGDCKDKVNLFCAILDLMNIEAHPVLVNSLTGTAAETWAPSPYAFNHVVAQVRINGKFLWFDPTLAYQRGSLTNLFFPDYARGLVIAATSFNLTKIPAQKAGLPVSTISDTFHFFSFTNPVSWEVRIIKQGADADGMRASLAQISKEELEKTYLNHYARLYPGIRTALPMEIRDDVEKNEIVIFQNYSISNVWEKSEDKAKWTMNFYFDDVADLTRKPQTSLRTLPLAVVYPRHQKQTTLVVLPEEGRFKSETNRFEDDAMKFARTVDYSRKELTINYDFDSLTNVVPVDEVPDHLTMLRQITDKCGYIIERPVARAAGKASEPNWMILMLAAMFLIVMVGVAALVYWFRPTSPAPPLINPDPTLTGLGGWLILVAIGLILKSFLLVLAIAKSSPAFSLERWTFLTTRGSAGYDPHWAPILIFELFGNLALVTFSILLIILFFQKRFAFPRMFIACMVCFAFVYSLDHMCASLVPAVKKSPPTAMLQAIFYMFIWTWYMLKSRRVKLTFVN